MNTSTIEKAQSVYNTLVGQVGAAQKVATVSVD